MFRFILETTPKPTPSARDRAIAALLEPEWRTSLRREWAASAYIECGTAFAYPVLRPAYLILGFLIRNLVRLAALSRRTMIRLIVRN